MFFGDMLMWLFIAPAILLALVAGHGQFGIYTYESRGGSHEWFCSGASDLGQRGIAKCTDRSCARTSLRSLRPYRAHTAS